MLNGSSGIIVVSAGMSRLEMRQQIMRGLALAIASAPLVEAVPQKPVKLEVSMLYDKRELINITLTKELPFADATVWPPYPRKFRHQMWSKNAHLQLINRLHEVRLDRFQGRAAMRGRR